MNTSRELMDRAQHCLNTGQPNLAELYIAKARLVVQQEREDIMRRRMQLAAVAAVRPIIREFNRMWQEALPEVQKALEDFSKAIARSAEVQQAHQDSIIRRKDTFKFPKPVITQTFGKPQPNWQPPFGHRS